MSVPITPSGAVPANLHVLTFAQLQTAARHAMGRGADANTSLGGMVNDALQYLASLHPWTWRQRPLSLNTTDGQEYVLLPEDFGVFHTLHQVSQFVELQPASLNQIYLWRQQQAISGGLIGYRYAVSYASQSTVADVPRARLELFPTPSETTTTGALVGVYLRTLRKLEGDDDLPDIPAQFHVLLKQLVRAVAVQQEEQPEGSGTVNADMAEFQRMLPRFILEDGGAQDILGRISGGGDDGALVSPLTPREITYF